MFFEVSGPNDIVLENIVPPTTGMNDTLKFTVGPYSNYSTDSTCVRKRICLGIGDTISNILYIARFSSNKIIVI